MARRSGQVTAKGQRNWEVRWYVGEVDGKRVYDSEVRKGTKREAEEYLAERLAERSRNAPAEARKMTVDQWLDRVIEIKSASRKPRTVEDYHRFFDGYVRPALGEIAIQKLETHAIQSLVAKVAKKSSTEANSMFRHLNAALRLAVKHKILRYNPAEGVDVPKPKRRKKTVFTREQVRRFIEVARRSPNGVYYVFQSFTGLRPGEMCALRWSDLDERAKTIRVERSAQWLDNGKRVEIGETKTENGVRTIPLPASLMRDLGAHKAEQAERAFGLGAAYHRKLDLIFANTLGSYLNSRNMSRRTLKPILCDAFGKPGDERGLSERLADLPGDLAKFRPYDCRHLMATMLIAEGVDPQTVKSRMGHAHVSTIFENYVHPVDGQQERATETLDEVFGSSG